MRLPYLLSLLVVALAVIAERLNGRVWICTCGRVKLWEGDIWSAGNSQHLTDWYTPSHILHGILFYALLWLVARRLAVGWRFLAAILLEAGWEVVENSAFIIDRYRAVTISLGYAGDSILNSVSDIAAMALGFWIARRLPVRAGVALVLGAEALTAWTIRDGLALNILMLVHPVQAVLDWQGALLH